jgi:hypothetical protein
MGVGFPGVPSGKPRQPDTRRTPALGVEGVAARPSSVRGGISMSTDSTRRPYAVVGQGSMFDGAAYWATLVGVYLMVGGLMFYSGKEKLFDDDGNAPQGIKDQFKGTFLDTIPGTDAAWVILGILEFGVFLLLVASLVFLEFLPHRPKQFLQLGLAVAMLTFACLAFGQTATKQFAGTASLYTYFGSTVVILILVSMLPPNRSDRWLGGTARDDRP